MKHIIIKLTLLLFIFCLNFQTSLSQDLPEIKYESLDDLIELREDILHGTLDNGLKYYIMKNAKPENRMSLRMPVKVGSVDEDDDQQGLAHFFEHLCFNGTEDFPKSELIDFLEKTGVKFGAHLNAYTSFDETVYMLELPVDNDEIIEKGIQVLENWAHKVVMEEDEIEKERGVIVEEARLRGGVGERSFNAHKDVYFYGSKYKDRLPIGDTNLIRIAKYDVFKRFYDDWYRPDMMAVIIVGDVDVKKMEKLVIKYFNKLPKVNNPRKKEKHKVQINKEPLVSIFSDKEISYPQLSFGWRKEGKEEEGTFREYRNNIVNSLFGTMMNNRFNELRMSANPPFQFAFTSVSNGYGVESLDLVVIGKGNDYKSGIETGLEEVFRAGKFGFNASELERAKKELISNYEKSYNERDKMESASLAGEIKRHFLDKEAVPGIAYEFAFVKKILPEIKLEEINSIPKEYLAINSFISTISVPETGGSLISEADIKEIYARIQSSDLTAYEDDDDDAVLFDKEIQAGKIIKTDKLDDFDVEVWTLNNGAKIFVKSTDFKDDEILFSAFSRGGNSLYSDKDWETGRFAASIVNSSGIKEFDEIKLQKILSGKQISISPYINELSEGFRGSSNKNDLESMMQLLHLYYTDARLDDNAFESFKVRTKDAIENNKRNPNSILRDSVSAIMGSYHKRSMPLEVTELDAIDKNKLLPLYKDRFSGVADFNFIFVGNIDKNQLKTLVEKYIGSLPEGNKSENWKDIGRETPSGQIKKNFNKGIDQKSSVNIMFTLDDFKYSGKEKHRIESLSKVLSIKLREQLREEKGGVYGVGAYPRVSREPKNEAWIIISFGCDPLRVDELLKDVEMVINDLKDNPISDDNMQKITETQKREYELALKENRSWLNWIYESVWHGESIKEINNYPNIIESLTKSDITEAAKKYLNYDNLKEFVLFPEQ